VDNIEMDLKEIGRDGVQRVNLNQYSDKWGMGVVNTAMSPAVL
jgi:hypothetical protein